MRIQWLRKWLHEHVPGGVIETNMTNPACCPQDRPLEGAEVTMAPCLLLHMYFLFGYGSDSCGRSDQQRRQVLSSFFPQLCFDFPRPRDTLHPRRVVARLLGRWQEKLEQGKASINLGATTCKERTEALALAHAQQAASTCYV